MRGDQLTRQWRVLRHIEASRNGVTAKQIEARCGIPLRTVYRDIGDLERAGFPLYQEKEGDGGGRWKLIRKETGMPSPFTLTELLSLHLSRDLFKIFKGTLFHDSVESLFEKVRAVLAPETLTYLENFKATFHMGGRPCKDYGRFREIVNQVHAAAVEKRCIDIVYTSLGNDEPVRRKVSPYKIWFFDGTIYLIGRCHLRDEIRTFVLDRISMLDLTDECFEVPNDFAFEDYTRHSFKVMQDELYNVRIRISPDWARYVGEKIWHESQCIQKQLDGGIEISFRVAGLDEIRQWVLSMGPEAQVIEPPELKAMVATSMSKALGQYDGQDLTSESFEGAVIEEPRTKFMG